ncbi:MAG TPA: universal stress protein [Burkholderiales bacterium]|nr:universal stress protein [Burkholderiales bacterium]
MYKRILAPIDGSPTSNQGLVEAVALAADQRAELMLLHVLDALVWMADLTGMENVSELPAFLRKNREELLAEAKKSIAEQGVEAQTVLRETLGGRVAEMILKEAGDWGADLIVMGTHGRRGLTHLVLGSDAEAVLHGARVPVLLIRGPVP